MRNTKTYTVQYRRKREGKTDYHKRMGLLKSGQARLVIRKSISGITAQIIQYSPVGDKVIASASSTELKKYGWKTATGNVPSSYLTGFLIAQKAKKAGIKSAIVDSGLYRSVKGSRIYAVVKGTVDNGLTIPCDKEIFPDQDRVSGKHVEEYAKSLESDKEKYQKQFSKYLKENVDPKSLTKVFEQVLSKIKGA